MEFKKKTELKKEYKEFTQNIIYSILLKTK